MQTFEFLLLLVTVGYLILNRSLNKRLRTSQIFGILSVLLITHLVIEGFRWQLFPTYFLWLIAIITALRAKTNTAKLWVKIVKGFGISVCTALAIALPTILPVFELPTPTGPYHVGTNDIELQVDRPEVITTDPNDTRRVMVKVWYPSDSVGDHQDPYVDKAGRSGFAQKYGLPSYAFNYLDKIDTHVYRNVPIADSTFPVLIFSHGYNSKANSYYALLSEIASQGYVIFAVNHTYESTGTTFADGSHAYFDYAYADAIQQDTWHWMEPVVAAFKSDMSYEERHPIVQKGLVNYFVRDMSERWAVDISDIVDHLEQWNANTFFNGAIDTNTIGVFGHSRGGGAAGEALLTDTRIKAGANIDGVQWGQIVDTAFDKPFLFISADWPAEKEDLNAHAYINKSRAVFYESRILGTGHSNFMDIPFMIPVQEVSQAGSIDPFLGMEITNTMVTSFFDKHLKNKVVDMDALGTQYEALQFQTHTVPPLTDDLALTLQEIFIHEQTPIRKRDSVMQIYGPESKEMEVYQKQYRANHAENIYRIKKLLNTYGWPDPELIGANGNRTICNVLQHADQDTREHYVPLMKQAVLDHKLEASLLVRHQDRLLTDKGELQWYGGQMKYYPETKSFNVWPVYDPANIDKRRAEIGLGPIAEFLKMRFDFDWDLEEQLQRTAAFEAEMAQREHS